MPLLKGRFVIPVKPLTDVKPEETIYTIPHTNEQFRSREEYERRVALYRDTIWTCRCTGHISLTHEEARKSEEEKYTQLQHQFPEYFYKPVLMLVHHSTEVLESLVVDAWTRLHQRLVVDEPVALKFKSQGNLIKGMVVKVESDVANEPLKPGPVNGCSPSSDKENKDSTAGTDHSDSPKKWTPIKLLPCKYNIRLQEGDTVISGVPSQDIVRLNRPPSKELIKLFIRAFAIRGGYQQNSPWSVQEDLVKKYSIPSKFADFLVSTSKMMEYGKKAMEEASKNLKKRKLSTHSSESQLKKRKSDAKHDKSQEKKPSAKKQLMLKMKDGSPAKLGSHSKDGTPKKTTPKQQDDGSGDLKMENVHSPELDKLGSKLDSDESSSEDDISLATLKKSVDLTGEEASSSSSEDENIALADLKPLTKLVDGKKHSGKRGLGKKSSKDAKKMKQMTLFDMKNKKKASSTPKKASSSTPKSPMGSPRKSPYKQPPIVIRLQKAHRDSNKALYYQLLSMCVRELSGVQRNRLPLSVKDDVMKRWKRKQEKKKVALMTPEQKEAYIAQKREELRKALKKKRAALHKRHEDTHLELKPLPPPKLVPTPDTLPNELFGDVVMVTMFISCYRGLLMPEDEQPVSTDLLMKALVEGEKGFTYLAHVLVIMLQTLLQDGVAEGYTELAMPLADLPANLYTVSELVRLCLRHDDDVDSMSEEGIDDDEYMVSDAIIERLETCELYTLEPKEKLQVLVGLCHRLMTTYSAQDFMTSRQQASLELCRQKNATLKEQKKTKTSSLDGQKKVADKTNETNKDGNTDGLTITHFYGAKEAEGEAPVIEEAASLAEVVKKRRLLAAKAIEEKAQREREEAERRRIEAEELKRQREEELFEKAFTEGVAQAKSVLRQCPIGTDRNHSRYWVFDGTTPGLYIEKGWVHESIGYRVRLVPDEDASTDDDSMLDFSSDCESNFDGRRRKQLEMERTVPPVGQNLWFTYNSLEDIDALLSSLHPQGIRESSLQAELKKRYPSIAKTMSAPKKPETVDPDLMADGSKALVEGFRQEMSDLEARLRSGGLGGVPNYDDWLNKLNTVSTIKEFGECLTLSQRSVCNKFITGILAKTVKKKPTAVSVEPEDEQKEGEVKEETEEKPDEELVYLGMQSWTDAIDSCPTFSRLHLLLSIFDSCVKWEKSAENAKCKICRKKRCEDKLLLCDECNQAFHLYCLRPALSSVPPGDWFCPSCSPTAKNRSRDRNYRELDGEEELSGDTTETDLLCMVCRGDTDVIVCSTCTSAFHLDCHQPPLRRPPRSNWRCAQCTSGVRFRRQSRRTASQRKVYNDDYDSCTTEEDISPRTSHRLPSRSKGKVIKDTEEDEAMCNGQKRGRFTKTKQKKTPPSRASRTRVVQETDSDDTEEEEEEEDEEEEEEVGEEEEEDTSVDTKILLMIVRKLERHRQAWPFMEKVDIDEVPDYYDIVKNPIDLETIREKITGDKYATYQQFIDDVEQLFYNARLYNKADSIVGQCIGPMQKYSQDLVVRHLPQCVETSGGEERTGSDNVCSTPSVLNGGDH